MSSLFVQSDRPLSEPPSSLYYNIWTHRGTIGEVGAFQRSLQSRMMTVIRPAAVGPRVRIRNITGLECTPNGTGAIVPHPSGVHYCPLDGASVRMSSIPSTRLSLVWGWRRLVGVRYDGRALTLQDTDSLTMDQIESPDIVKGYSVDERRGVLRYLAGSRILTVDRRAGGEVAPPLVPLPRAARGFGARATPPAVTTIAHWGELVVCGLTDGSLRVLDGRGAGPGVRVGLPLIGTIKALLVGANNRLYVSGSQAIAEVDLTAGELTGRTINAGRPVTAPAGDHGRVTVTDAARPWREAVHMTVDGGAADYIIERPASVRGGLLVAPEPTGDGSLVYNTFGPTRYMGRVDGAAAVGGAGGGSVVWVGSDGSLGRDNVEYRKHSVKTGVVQ